MGIEAFFTRIKTIESYLQFMPVPLNVPLTTDQFKAIIEQAIPSEWFRALNERESLGRNSELPTTVQFVKVLEANENKKKFDGASHRSSKSRTHLPGVLDFEDL